MRTGYRGTFVISWTQTELDGIVAAPLDLLVVGATWRWTGEAVRVDGPQGLLVLSGDPEAADVRRRAAHMVRRLVGTALAERPQVHEQAEDDDVPDRGFVLTDGRRSFFATLIEAKGQGARLLMFVGEVPQESADLWVVRTSVGLEPPVADNPLAGGVICFTPGTRITTPDGPKLIETLRPGDVIQTKDDGPQPILWAGSRRMTGARLFAMPHLRPVRVRMGALGAGRPDGDLVISPQHRLLVKGPSAQALFNVPEVLVAACDLVNDRSILIDSALKEVTYVHILLERHQVVWANGLETESFHPSNTSLETVNPVQRSELLSIFPGIDTDPNRYGGFARRNLTATEAAILRHDTAA